MELLSLVLLHIFELIIIIILLIIVTAIIIILILNLSLWIRALISNAPVSLFSIIGMRLRKVPPAMIINSRIQAVKAGINLSPDQLESHHLAGGDVPEVVQALVAAKAASIPLTFEEACRADLAKSFQNN